MTQAEVPEAKNAKTAFIESGDGMLTSSKK